MNALADCDNNVCLGFEAGTSITTSGSNIMIGYRAGDATSGGGGIFIGNDCLQGATGGHGRGFYIGYKMESSSNNTTVDDEGVLAVGEHTATGKGNGTLFISCSAYTGGNGNVYQKNNSADWATTSDRRLKKDIVDNNSGLDVLKQIQVRNFKYRSQDEIEDDSIKNQAIEGHNGTTQIGVIAQELEPILPDAIITNSDTTVKTVEGDSIKWYLVNAVKELAAENAALKARLDAAGL